jgi:hypothetical protein
MFSCLDLDIRTATPGDETTLRRLAMLENRHAFPGPALLAVLDGRPVAAMTLDGRDWVADPFVATAHVVEAMRALVADRDNGRRAGPQRPWRLAAS